MAPGSGLSLYFLNAEERSGSAARLSEDIRMVPLDSEEPASRGERWVFDVVRSGGDEQPAELRLDFEELGERSPGIELRLIDRDLDREVDVPGTGSYTFVASRRDYVARAADARFELIAGTAAYLASASAGASHITHTTRLLPTFPNPVASTCVVRFESAQKGRVTLSVFDFAGRRVATVTDGVREAGMHEIAWRSRDDAGRDLPAGVYAMQLVASGRRDVRKLVVIR